MPSWKKIFFALFLVAICFNIEILNNDYPSDRLNNTFTKHIRAFHTIVFITNGIIQFDVFAG